MHIYQKDLTNNALIFLEFGRKTQIVGNFWENFEIIWWKFNKKFNFYLLFIFQNLLQKIEPSEIPSFSYNFSVSGDFHLPPGYAHGRDSCIATAGVRFIELSLFPNLIISVNILLHKLWLHPILRHRIFAEVCFNSNLLGEKFQIVRLLPISSLKSYFCHDKIVVGKIPFYPNSANGPLSKCE